MPNRRQFLKNTAAAVAGISLPAWAGSSSVTGASMRKDPLRLIIVGGGVGGAQLATQLQYQTTIKATLFDPVSRGEFLGATPALGSEKGIRSRPHAMRTIPERILSIDPIGHYVMDSTGTLHGYDRLVLAPGIAYDYSAYEHIDAGIPAAWMRGPEPAQLSAKLQDMEPGGVVVITVPERPYRYTEGPYLRAMRVATWLKRHKPGSKVLLLDENDADERDDRLMLRIRSMMEAVEGVEWQRGVAIQRAARKDDGFELVVSGERITGEVLNLIPPQRASGLAERASLTEGAWCPRDPETLVSTLVDSVHIMGDAARETEAHQKRALTAQRDADLLARLLMAEAG